MYYAWTLWFNLSYHIIINSKSVGSFFINLVISSWPSRQKQWLLLLAIYSSFVYNRSHTASDVDPVTFT